MAEKSFLVLLTLLAVACSTCVDWKWEVTKLTATNYQTIKEAQFECMSEAENVYKQRSESCKVMPSEDSFKHVVGLANDVTAEIEKKDFTSCGLFGGFTELTAKYVASVSKANWHHARICCLTIGAELAMPKTIKELTTIKETIHNKKLGDSWYWLGGNDIHREGFWVFNDGTPMDRILFGKGQPTDTTGLKNCLFLHKWSEKLFDYYCGGFHNFICQFK